MKLEESISLIQWYYHFLYMGKYLDKYIKKNDLSKNIEKTIVTTGKETTFWLNSKTLESLFASAHKHADKDNVFGYMVELNAIRWIISTMRELIENSPKFKRFLQERISRQYFPFEQIIRLTRNVMAHSYDPKMTIKIDDFINQKTYWSSKGIKTIHFLFKYYHYREERTGDKEYGIDIKINFNTLKAGTPLFKAITLHQLYLFSELCYNLTKLYYTDNKKNKTNVKIKSEISSKWNKKKTASRKRKTPTPNKKKPTKASKNSASPKTSKK